MKNATWYGSLIAVGILLRRLPQYVHDLNTIKTVFFLLCNHFRSQISDIKFYTEGRVIVLNTENTTIVYAYPKAGTDAESRQEREEFFNTIIPNMLQYTKQNLIMGGDWNCITENPHCTN